MVTTEMIETYFIMGRFFIPGILSGWRYYPITHKNNLYTVEIKVHHNFALPPYISGTIYEYSTSGSIFVRHKGKKIYMRNISFLPLNDHATLCVADLTVEEYLQMYPEIIKALFRAMEMDNQSEDKKV